MNLKVKTPFLRAFTLRNGVFTFKNGRKDILKYTDYKRYRLGVFK